MSNLVEVGNSRDFAEGTMKEVVIEGREILLARVGDSYYAASNRCPHMGAKLSDGSIEGTVVTCPRHGSGKDASSHLSCQQDDQAPPIISHLCCEAGRRPHSGGNLDRFTRGSKSIRRSGR